MPGPWKQVEHIDDFEGERGGQFWYLTLECGHTCFHPKPMINATSCFRGITFAPQKKRCRMCHISQGKQLQS